MTVRGTMKIVVGLGNPGRDYEGTRHNVGFELIDALASRQGVKLDQRAARALFARTTIAGESVLLVKPQTFMNLSGDSVKAIMTRENAALTDLLIICDDIHLPVGKLRLRGKGSSGGQNGLKSIAAELGNQDWARLRIGVGAPPPGLQVEWVLGRFARSDRTLVDDALILGLGAVELWITSPVEVAISRVNADPPLL